jgi:hypothetical protein
MEHCDSHEQLIVDIATIKERTIAIDDRINGSIDDIKKHIEHGQAWRIGICGVAVGLVLQTVALAFMWGRLVNTVEFNTRRLNIIEDLHRIDESKK